jgi:hypothetical protein
MTSTATSSTDRRARALSDLGQKIRDLSLIAEIALYYLANSPCAANRTREQERDDEKAVLLVTQVDSMASDLEKAFDEAVAKKEAT